ncbi:MULTISPECIES: DUF4268 domain-containing protein [Cyanophyceae]|uniref:DUF4268 domain-containing protein n=1 Tax=Cyanophyceae TaxID=3028117 RepID=UPI001682317C|nr:MULTISPECIES: DUF4268 domain-containing protein [unclassified Phormidium]MBD1918004.1 DUF4268 domain-containing protein [Phormidium sp. FACHB-77]MBD2029252.1 DUF4268 domain-containing protein [Phormidium sp. FACHB-322]MBD2049784.1 DUF4268 domain-containing protein [Leptolyngbya sp. FACHB-60]
MPKRAAKPKLGRLQKLDPTDYWQTQADFQQWLIEAETLDLLGEAAGLSLDPPETDSLAELGYALLNEADTGSLVLVVAHLEEPDLLELGQLLAWAAAENANAVLWVAPDFSEAAALTFDWLNQSSEITFLGLTVELWQIGKAAMAANFIPMCGAVDDSEADLEAEDTEDVAPKEPELLTPLQQQNLEFWSGLCDRMDRQGSLVKPGSPTPEATIGFAIARAGFRLNAILDRDHGSLYTELLLSGIDAQPHFHLLAEEREAIVDEMGLPLIWDGTGDQACMVASTLAEVDLDNRDRWPDYQAWFCDCLERFYEAFFDRIKRLDANGYQPLPKRAAMTDTLVLPARPRG